MSHLQLVPVMFKHIDNVPRFYMKILNPDGTQTDPRISMACPNVRYLAHIFDAKIQQRLLNSGASERAKLFKEIEDPFTVLMFYTENANDEGITVQAYRTSIGWVYRK